MRWTLTALVLSLSSLASGQPAISPPSASPPVEAFRRARSLLLTRRFAELTTLVEQEHEASTRDPARADAFDWTIEPFRLMGSGITKLIQEWVEASPTSWAPLLARAINQSARAFKARGAGWAKDTTEAQFSAMGQLLTGMRADCAKVLTLAPTVCRCHVQLVEDAKLDGVEQDAVVERAFAACPLDYSLNVEHVFGLTPRWGGSYEAMRAAAAAARRRGMDDFHARSLEAYVPADRASLLWLDGKGDEAVAVLDEAIRRSPTPMLFQERSWFHHRRGDAPRSLQDANAALELSSGGWMFSQRRLTMILAARAWALNTLGRQKDAAADLALALEIAPNETFVLELRRQILQPIKVER